MFEFDPKEFPEIEKERAEAYAAVQDWLKLKQRWERARGNGVALPIETYADHPAYEWLDAHVTRISLGLMQKEAYEQWLRELLSKINVDSDGNILISGKGRDIWQKKIAFDRVLLNGAFAANNLIKVANCAVSLKVSSIIDFLLWDEAAFSLPISIRMRLEVNHAE